mgnify:FL=1
MLAVGCGALMYFFEVFCLCDDHGGGGGVDDVGEGVFVLSIFAFDFFLKNWFNPIVFHRTL